MKILSSPIKSSFTIKKSKFLCFGFFVQTKAEIKQHLDDLHKKYPDASHICYGYILDKDNYYYSDGGEPSGTAGKPIYSALDSFELNYCLFVVVRYFGGIKFGPGPLRSTFKEATLATLRGATMKQCWLTDIIQIHVPYSSITQINRIFKNKIFKEEYKTEYAIIDLMGEKQAILNQLKLINIKPVEIKEKQVVW